MRYDPKFNSRIGRTCRCHGSPIISEQTHGGADLSDLGKDPFSNINGPSVIRVPEWVSDPLGKYYLYFAHHKGTSIRLAYADQMTGPWFIHPKPVFTLQESLFVTQDLDPNSRSDWVNGPDYLYAHIASPDVHVDQNKTDIDVLSWSFARWRSTNTLSHQKMDDPFRQRPLCSGHLTCVHFNGVGVGILRIFGVMWGCLKPYPPPQRYSRIELCLLK